MGRIRFIKITFLLVIAIATGALPGLIPICRAQAIYAATEYGHIQAGTGAMLLNTDYGAHNKGLAFWVDCDLLRFIGIEGEARLGGLDAPSDIGENTYLAGPRFLLRKHHYTTYARVMAGRGSITNQFYGQSSTFNFYAVGGGVEYKVSRRLNVRAVDLELQKWPDFKPNPLSPTVITIGLSYVIR